MERYWQPLYFYARRQGLAAADAEDATQAFLMDLLEGNCLAAADPAKGRFRNYLLTLWKRFLIDRARYENRVKRGGGTLSKSLSCIDVEQAWKAWSKVSVTESDPDQAYYEQWASTIIDAALKRVRWEYQQSRRETIFEVLLPFVTLPIEAQGYRDLALRLDCTEGAAKVALHRLRHRFAQSLRQQVLETLDDPGDLETELQELIQYMSRRV